MPQLRTDDGPRRLRALWLGPNGATLPFEWTYVQWLVVLVSAGLVGNVLAALAWWWTQDLVYVVAAAVLWGWPAGAYLGTRIMRGVSFDEPLRYKIAAHRAQFQRRPTRLSRSETTWSMPGIVSAEVDPSRWGPE
jgi:hypothetical protein